MKQSKQEILTLLLEATSKFGAGLKVKVDDDTILFNWGDVLAEQAKFEHDPVEQEALYQQAISNYSRSTVDPITLNNWGFVRRFELDWSLF
jgi:hypothetical protein